MANPLEKEFQYFLDHRDELIAKYEGRFVVIKDQKVIGAFPSELDSLKATTKDHQIGTFLVQKCDRNPDSYTRTFHSRVLVA